MKELVLLVQTIENKKARTRKPNPTPNEQSNQANLSMQINQIAIPFSTRDEGLWEIVVETLKTT